MDVHAIQLVLRLLAVCAGAIVLVAPALRLMRSAGRPKGRAVGRGAAGRSWPAVLLMTVGFVGAGALLWHPLPLDIPAEGQLLVTGLGAVFYFPGVALYLWAFKTLGSEFGVSSLAGADLYAGHQLVTHGPFGWMRHPMYAGVLLVAVGALLIFRTWATLVFLPMSWVVVARAAREEALLADEFPDEWAQYVARVPRWIPRWFRRSGGEHRSSITERRSFMGTSGNSGNRAATWLRWIARGVGSLLAAAWLFVGLVSALDEPGPWMLESAIVAGLILATVAGTLVAWWRAGLGGAILVGCGIAHSTFAFFSAGHNQGLAMLISGGPWLLVGALFLASWWLARPARGTVNEEAGS